jgi:hypothetical protein
MKKEMIEDLLKTLDNYTPEEGCMKLLSKLINLIKLIEEAAKNDIISDYNNYSICINILCDIQEEYPQKIVDNQRLTIKKNASKNQKNEFHIYYYKTIDRIHSAVDDLLLHI